MTLLLVSRVARPRSRAHLINHKPTYRQFFSRKTGQPLRILFCGSDEFSAASLKKLHEEQQVNSELIASIDVVCKAGKPSGRGLKQIRDVPIKRVAEEEGLPVHEISTFTGWQPPTREGEAMNLVIAVSFGLLVPARILSGAVYGGLNLHPSLLPALRGPAPLHHTILQDLEQTGVTLQTLHPKHFDRGIILAQSHFALNEIAKASFSSLQDFLAPRAADLLVESLRRKVFVPPLKSAQDETDSVASHAPKLTSEDAHVDWKTWKAERILRAQKACGTLWNVWATTSSKGGKRTMRIQWHDLEIGGKVDAQTFQTAVEDRAVDEEALRPWFAGIPCIYSARDPMQWVDTSNGVSLTMRETRPNLIQRNRATSGEETSTIAGFWTVDGYLLCPRAITIEGGSRKTPAGNTNVVKKLLISATELGQSLA